MAIRLFGIDAPELKRAESHDAGVAAKSFLISVLARPGATAYPLVIRTIRDKADKYGGRWDGKVWREIDGHWNEDFQFVPDWPSINEQMVTAGHAVPYDGGKR